MGCLYRLDDQVERCKLMDKKNEKKRKNFSQGEEDLNDLFMQAAEELQDV